MNDQTDQMDQRFYGPEHSLFPVSVGETSRSAKEQTAAAVLLFQD